MSLRALDVSWSRGGAAIVNGIRIEVEPGSTLGLLGPNGSGKSSLLRLLAGLRQPSSGRVLVDDVDITGIGRRALARRIALVEQESTTELDITVTEVVSLGRTPHRSSWGTAQDTDAEAVRRALMHADLEALADRRWHTLSGGERQRVQIARALAQQPTELLLDEPTNHLDIAHQFALLELVRRLPVTAVVALHDLNLAATFCDGLVVLQRGAVVAAGSPAEVLTEDLVRTVYGVECAITKPNPEGPPHIRFTGTATHA
ncbi:ABC transporter ATP-binding protein [Saccharopolyspora hattusasensis]|uniref:ABC transporter ATP-binding protein n=1 Tax=Saccharopolyspora hattusasensis TaxID=1128679 RepID=UPI003D98B14F